MKQFPLLFVLLTSILVGCQESERDTDATNQQSAVDTHIARFEIGPSEVDSVALMMSGSDCYSVYIELADPAHERFISLTESCVGDTLVLVIGEEITRKSVVREPITTQATRISCSDLEEAQMIVDLLTD